MYTDSLGNHYTRLPTKPPDHRAKPSKGGRKKIGRSKRKGEWISKVKMRERQHREYGHRFETYGC